MKLNNSLYTFIFIAVFMKSAKWVMTGPNAGVGIAASDVEMEVICPDHCENAEKWNSEE